MELNIATYNISHCQDYSENNNDDAPVNISKTAELIKNINADIIGLNEVYIRGTTDENLNIQTEKIANITKYPFYSQAIGEDLGWAVIGNAILSKLPIKETFSVPVLVPTEDEKRPNENDWYENRVILGANVQVKDKELLVLSTHFGLNALEQEKMVKSLCEIIDKSSLPIILMGDFNALPHSDVLKPIYNRLVSCADDKNNDDFTFSSFAPEKTIDYIFVSKNIKINSFEVRNDIVSDHLPCLSELEIQ